MVLIHVYGELRVCDKAEIILEEFKKLYGDVKIDFADHHERILYLYTETLDYYKFIRTPNYKTFYGRPFLMFDEDENEEKKKYLIAVENVEFSKRALKNITNLIK